MQCLHISKKMQYQVVHKNGDTINKDNSSEDEKKVIFNSHIHPQKLRTQKYSEMAQAHDLLKVLVQRLLTALFNKHYIWLGLKEVMDNLPVLVDDCYRCGWRNI